MVNGIIEHLQTIWINIDTTFEEWYEIQLWSKSIPRKTGLQINWSNIPSSSPLRNTTSLSFVDSLISQLNDWFPGETAHPKALLCLILSVILSFTVKLFGFVDDFLYRDPDLLCSKYHSSELWKWHTLEPKWGQEKHQESPYSPWIMWPQLLRKYSDYYWLHEHYLLLVLKLKRINWPCCNGYALWWDNYCGWSFQSFCSSTPQSLFPRSLLEDWIDTFSLLSLWLKYCCSKVKYYSLFYLLLMFHPEALC